MRSFTCGLYTHLTRQVGSLPLATNAKHSSSITVVTLTLDGPYMYNNTKTGLCYDIARHEKKLVETI